MLGFRDSGVRCTPKHAPGRLTLAGYGPSAETAFDPKRPFDHTALHSGSNAPATGIMSNGVFVTS